MLRKEKANVFVTGVVQVGYSDRDMFLSFQVSPAMCSTEDNANQEPTSGLADDLSLPGC